MQTTALPDTLPFSLSYHDGYTGPKLAPSEFACISDAVAFATKKKISLSWLSVTEWDADDTDAFGVPAIVGSCSLDEAAEGNYTSLNFN